MNIFEPAGTRAETWAALMLLVTMLIFIALQNQDSSIDFGVLSLVLWAATFFSFSVFKFYERTLERFVFVKEYRFDINFFEKGDPTIIFALQLACFGYVLGYTIDLIGYYIQRTILELMTSACRNANSSGFDFWLGSNVCFGILKNGSLNSIGVFTLLVGIPGFLFLKFLPPFLCARYIARNIFSHPYLCMLIVGILFQVFSLIMGNDRTFLGILYFLSDMDKAWLIERVQDLQENIETKKSSDASPGLLIVVAFGAVAVYAFFTLVGIAFLSCFRYTDIDRLKIERAARLMTPENYKVSANFLMLKAGIADGTHVIVRHPGQVSKNDADDHRNAPRK